MVEEETVVSFPFRAWDEKRYPYLKHFERVEQKKETPKDGDEG
jgi:hypothetical protein